MTPTPSVLTPTVTEEDFLYGLDAFASKDAAVRQMMERKFARRSDGKDHKGKVSIARSLYYEAAGGYTTDTVTEKTLVSKAMKRLSKRLNSRENGAADSPVEPAVSAPTATPPAEDAFVEAPTPLEPTPEAAAMRSAMAEAAQPATGTAPARSMPVQPQATPTVIPVIVEPAPAGASASPDAVPTEAMSTTTQPHPFDGFGYGTHTARTDAQATTKTGGSAWRVVMGALIGLAVAVVAIVVIGTLKASFINQVDVLFVLGAWFAAIGFPILGAAIAVRRRDTTQQSTTVHASHN